MKVSISENLPEKQMLPPKGLDFKIPKPITKSITTGASLVSYLLKGFDLNFAYFWLKD